MQAMCAGIAAKPMQSETREATNRAIQGWSKETTGAAPSAPYSRPRRLPRRRLDRRRRRRVKTRDVS